jgi:hypothetical protein
MPENLSQFGVFGNSRHGKHGSHVENGAPGFRTGWTTDIVPVNPASSGEYRSNGWVRPSFQAPRWNIEFPCRFQWFCAAGRG